MARSDNAKPFLLWLQRDVDADLIRVISEAAKHRRATAEICRLLRLGLVADARARSLVLADSILTGPGGDRGMPPEAQQVPGYVRAVFIFRDAGMLSRFRDEIYRQGIRIPTAPGGYRQYKYLHSGSIGWPVLVANLREGLVCEVTDECGFMTTDPFDEPTDGPVSFEQFYIILRILQEIARPRRINMPARAVLEQTSP